MDCVLPPVMLPGERAGVTVTLFEALPVEAVRLTDPLEVQITCICGKGVPLLHEPKPTIVPPLTHQLIEVLKFQLPLMVYEYCCPATTQLGPLMDTCAFAIFCEAVNARQKRISVR